MSHHPVPVRPRLRMTDRVGVRELRQNLSVYLARVVAGERLEVTDRGVPVALFVPLPPAATVVERLVAGGRATRATKQIAELPPLKGRLPAGLGARLQRALQESRDERL